MNSRRQFLSSGFVVAGAAMLSNHLYAAEEKERVSPNEDLMREHGVLRRVLLIYRNLIDRIEKKVDFPPNTVVDAANIIRNFIEEYHEKLEEHYLFPRLAQHHTFAGLVDVLTSQHQRGRAETDRIFNILKTNPINDKVLLRDHLMSFTSMYAPHAAREDTVLFPAFKAMLSPNDYDALGEQFEDKEHELFGEDGFAAMVDKVERIEKKLGIYDLSQFTPQIE